MKTTLSFVADSLTDEIKQEALAFWANERALADGVAIDRAEQLVAIARGDASQIVAVASAERAIAPIIAQPVLSYRTFVAKAHRREGIATRLLDFSFQEVEPRVCQQSNPQTVGMLLRYSPELAAWFDEHLFWPSTQFSFLGRMPNGDHLRIRYFDEVKLRWPEQ